MFVVFFGVFFHLYFFRESKYAASLQQPRVLPEPVVSVSHLLGFQLGGKDLDDVNEDEEVHLKGEKRARTADVN